MKIAKQMKVSELPAFDAGKYLSSSAEVAAYLTAVLDEGNPAMFVAALGDVARARGMSEIAKAAGITREALNEALRPDAEPRFETVNRVCAALGVRLVAQASHG